MRKCLSSTQVYNNGRHDLKYKYQAVDSSGKKQTGSLDAPDKATAFSIIKNRGLTPLSVKEDTSKFMGATKGPKAKNPRAKKPMNIEIMEKDIHSVKLKGKKVLGVLEQFAIMSKAGVSLTTCMQVLILQERDRKMKKILLELQDDLHSGRPLSASMSKFRSFSEVTTSIVSAGEIDGKMDEAFQRASMILENEIKLTQKVKSAMSYPLFLLIVTFVATTVLNLVVLPTFSGMFDQFGQDMPALTRVVMGISDIFLSYWYIFVLIFGGGVGAYFFGRKKSDNFRKSTDHLLLKIPLIGEIAYKLYISRFCRVMASLTGAGVEIIYSLSVATRVVSNAYLKHFFYKVLEDVKVGVAINDSMRRYPVFDSLFISMVGVAEESGEISGVLDKMAELYETQTETQTKLLTSLIEPVMTVLMALIVGTVVLSVVLPMFGQYSLLL